MALVILQRHHGLVEVIWLRGLETLLAMSEPVESDKDLASRLYAEWDHGRGSSKSALERRTWNDGRSHGRRFDRFILTHLGINTTSRSKQTDRIKDLERQVRSLGKHPVGTDPNQEQIQLLQSREACLSALRIWNDPTASFRTGAFSLLFVTAWNSLLIAVSLRNGIEWRDLKDDGSPVETNGSVHAISTRALLSRALQGSKWHGTRENLKFWIELRNNVAHRFLPIVDLPVIPYAQAGLLNYERLLVDEFGSDCGLSEHLSVPLQLSGFRDPNLLRSLKEVHSQLPLDIQNLLSRAESRPDELLGDPTYVMRVGFVPVVPPSGRSPDAVAYFVRPEDVDSDLADAMSKYVVLPKVIRPQRPEYGAKYVVDEVGRHIPFRLNTNDHARAARFLKVRPERGEREESLDERYCDYISAAKIYVYNQKWIDRLVQQLSTPEGYKEVTGREPILQERPSGVVD